MVKAAAAERYAQKTEALAGDVGQRIRKARQDRGMSLAQVGGEDLSRSFLSLVELGRSRISLRALAIVSDRLNLPMSYFLESSTASPEMVGELQLDRAESALRRGSFEEARRTLNAAEIGDLLQARERWLRGWTQLELGQSREAIPTLYEALRLAKESENTRLQAEVEYTLGKALLEGANYEEALVHLRRVLKQASSEPKDEPLMAKVFVALGHVQSSLGNQDEAANSYSKANELLELTLNLVNLTTRYGHLSSRSFEHGDLREALRYSHLSLGVSEAIQSRRTTVEDVTAMATRSKEMGRLEEARAYAERGIALAREGRAGEAEAIARSTLAGVYLDMGRPEEAVAEARVAEELAGADGNPAAVAAWLILAKVAASAEDHARADDLYRRALDHLAATGNPKDYATAAYEYSLALRKRGDTEAALNFALKAAQPPSVRSG